MLRASVKLASLTIERFHLNRIDVNFKYTRLNCGDSNEIESPTHRLPTCPRSFPPSPSNPKAIRPPTPHSRELAQNYQNYVDSNRIDFIRLSQVSSDGVARRCPLTLPPSPQSAPALSPKRYPHVIYAEIGVSHDIAKTDDAPPVNIRQLGAGGPAGNCRANSNPSSSSGLSRGPRLCPIRSQDWVVGTSPTMTSMEGGFIATHATSSASRSIALRISGRSASSVTRSTGTPSASSK
jgi:hypothetical protein